LYVVHTIFADNLNPTHQQCIGAISLIIWNLIILVSIKYAVFILMADNRGEGGTFALCGLLTGENSKLRARAKHVISIVSILAASLLIGKRRSLIIKRKAFFSGDGAITPAISVLSAIEGLIITAPSLEKWVVPITVVIIIALFLVQLFGTSKIGIWIDLMRCISHLLLLLLF
jgi:KUP system potassium uptake protein